MSDPTGAAPCGRGAWRRPAAGHVREAGGEAYLSQLARAAGIDRRRALAALVGDPPRRTELSLVALGLAQVADRPEGRIFVVTTRGLRRARSWTSARARRAEASRSGRDVLAA